jgi:hypothetical protein
MTTFGPDTAVASAVTISAFAWRGGRRAGPGCDAGVEWRLVRVGSRDNVCRCPANRECAPETRCDVLPAAGDKWQVTRRGQASFISC